MIDVIDLCDFYYEYECAWVGVRSIFGGCEEKMQHTHTHTHKNDACDSDNCGAWAVRRSEIDVSAINGQSVKLW